MKKYSFILIMLVMIVLTNCRPKPIDIDVKPAPVKLVVTAQVIPGSIMIVGLTRSFSALSSGANADTIPNNFLDSILVPNAIVTVEHSSQIDTLYMLTPGIYASLNVLLVDYNTYT
ncbi:MAG TPA: hypothetical protein VL651_00935, partial [Bacteroidia bacterium]|nr:hypothetical protein [Bacteroidia bacterium]